MLSYGYLGKLTQNHSFATKINLKMLTLNLSFLLLVLGTEVWFFFSIRSVGLDTVLIAFTISFIRLIIKFFLLAFLAAFG